MSLLAPRMVDNTDKIKDPSKFRYDDEHPTAPLIMGLVTTRIAQASITATLATFSPSLAGMLHTIVNGAVAYGMYKAADHFTDGYAEGMRMAAFGEGLAILGGMMGMNLNPVNWDGSAIYDTEYR